LLTRSRAPGLLDDQSEQAGVLLGDRVVGVEHRDHDVRLLDCLQRLDDAELLDRFADRARRRTPAVSISV